MTYRATTAVVLALALAACQGGSPTKPGAAASPRAATGASPRPARSTAPAAAGLVASVLRPLGGQVAKLSGRVTLDARYATAAGGASRLIGADGGTLIGMDGASLISDDGSTLISDDGSTLIGNAGGTLIGADGATSIGADGATLVAGGRIVGARAGVVAAPAALVGGEGRLLLGADGSNLISDDGPSRPSLASRAFLRPGDRSTALARPGAYALAQAAEPLFGDARPAAGTWVSVVDMRDGLTVPLGKDAAGAEVHTVYTDAQGGFAVEVPAAARQYLRVVARAPGRRDPRLALHVLTAADGGARTIDEAEAAIAGFLRYVMARRTLDHLGFGREPIAADDVTGQLFALAFAPVRDELAKIRQGPGGDAAMEEVALLVADRILVEAGYENLKMSSQGITPRHPKGGDLVGKPVVEELRGVMTRMQDRVRDLARAQADPVAWFGNQPWLLAANLGAEPASRYVIERPADMFDYLAREYLAQGRLGQDEKAFEVMAALDLPLLDRDRVAMAGPSLFGAIADVMAKTEGQTNVERLAALVRDAGQRLAGVGPRPAPPAPARTAPPPPSAPPAEPARTVEVLAGHPEDPGTDGTPSAMDGRGREAYFGEAVALALDERATSPVLYVADRAIERIRRVTLDADGGATVASLETDARIGRPTGVAVGPDGALYVSDQWSHSIFRLRPEATGPIVVERLAGGGEGFADGPGATARFHTPAGLTIAPDGALVVADQDNRRLRRIDLADPAHPVTTIAGTGTAHTVDGPVAATPGDLGHPGAMLISPTDVVYGADGALYVADGLGAIRRVVRPGAPDARLEVFAGTKFKYTGVIDGYFHRAGIAAATGMAMDPRTGHLIVADNRNHRIRQVRTDRWITTIAGQGEGDVTTGDFLEGAGEAAAFNQPMDVAVAKDGTIFVADSRNHVIRRIRP